MYKAIFARISHKTKKYPKRIKVFDIGKPEYYLYQEDLNQWENFALACQHFCNIKVIDGKWFAAIDKDGFVFIKINEFFYVDKNTNFDEFPQEKFI